MNPSVLILIRRGEARAKCTIRPLRGTPGLDFRSYPLREQVDLSRHRLLAPDAPPLTMADGDCPLLLLDASWRQAEKMRRAVGPMECRAIPSGWQTAYPRRSKTHEDPGRGLATVEALYAAFCTLGRRDDRLLAFYPWKDVFLALNAALLPAESMFS